MLNLLIFLTTSIVNAGLIILVVTKRKRDWHNPIVLTFISSVLFFIGWFASNYLADSASNPVPALFWTRLTVPFSLWALCFLLWFTFIFPVQTENYKNKLLFHFLIVLVISVAVFSNWIFAKVEITPKIGVTNLVLGQGYIAMIVVYILLILHIMINLTSKYRKLTGMYKAQLKYLFTGWVLFLIGAAFLSLVLPYILEDASVSKFGALFSIVMVGFITYAIVKHQLMDIRVVIQRGLIFTFLLTLMVAVYLALVFFLGNLFQRITNTVILSGLLTTVIGIFGVKPLEAFFRKVTDQWFFKHRYDYAEALQNLSEILNENFEFHSLKSQITQTLIKILKCEYVDLVMINGEPMQVLPDSLSIDIKLKDNVIGKLVLGPKLSGDPYDPTDLKLLQTFTTQSAVALERALLFEEVKKYSQELEQRVSKRTEEIAKIQETQKQIMIEIAHNLQTPLTIVKSQIESLQLQTGDSAKFKTFERSLDDVSQFIYDLLKWAKLERDLEIKQDTVDLSALLREMIEYFEIICLDKNIKLTSQIESGITIFGEKQKLQDLIINLISNAVKYIDNERTIHVQLQKDQEHIKLSIRDSGIGIPEATMTKLFQPFYRGGDESKQIRGSGLGLAICKRIAQLHHGNIVVQSEIGKGSTFTVSFKKQS